MGRRLVSMLFVAAVTAAIAVQAASTARSTARATTEVVSGTLVDANGNALPQLQVYLYLPPATYVSSYKSVPVGTGVTDASGHFSIVAERTATFSKQAAANAGWLNFDLVATDGKLTIYRSVPRQVTKGGYLGPAEDNGATALATATLALGQPGVGPVKGRRSSSQATGCSQSSTVVGPVAIATTVGELHTFNGGAIFDYGPVANSDIDSVVRVGSAAWSVGVGPVHISTARTSAAVIHAAAGFHHQLRTTFTYQKTTTTNTCTGVRVTIKPLAWATSKLSLAATTDLNSTCGSTHRQSFAAGSQFTRNSNLANRWTPAVNLSALGGPAALASARSGYYPSRVWSKWTFASAGSLCGDTALPTTALRIFAGG